MIIRKIENSSRPVCAAGAAAATDAADLGARRGTFTFGRITVERRPVIINYYF